MKFFRRLWTRLLLARHRTSDREIRSLFSYLAQLDASDFVEVYPGVTMIGYAAFVHVRAGADQLTISTSLFGQIVVQELAKKAEKVNAYYPHFPVKTRWREVYRSGEVVKSVAFVVQLRRLKEAVEGNHVSMGYGLEALKYVLTVDDDGLGREVLLDECVYDPKSPGFLLRSRENNEVFYTLTYAEAVNALTPHKETA